MGKCPKCLMPLFGFVHSNGKEQGKICLKCHQKFDVEPLLLVEGIDYEDMNLSRQEAMDM